MTISELNFDCASIAICDAGSFLFWLNISDPADRAFLDRAVSGPECARDGQELFELCGRFGIHKGLIAGKTDILEVSANVTKKAIISEISRPGIIIAAA